MPAKLYLAPTLALVGALFVAPLVLMAAYSFGTQAYLSTDVTIGPTLEQYRRAFEEPTATAIRNSVFVGTATATMCAAIGYPAAYVIARRSGRLQGLLLLLLMIPLWTSALIRTYAWTGLLSSTGMLASAWRAVGSDPQMLSRAGSSGVGVFIVMVYTYLPLMVLPLYASLEQIDVRHLQAAADLGASPRSAFWRVTLPESVPGISAGFVLVAVPASGEFIVPQIVGGGRSLLLGNLIATQFGSSLNWPFGAAIAAVGMAQLAVLLGLIAFLTRRWRS